MIGKLLYSVTLVFWKKKKKEKKKKKREFLEPLLQTTYPYLPTPRPVVQLSPLYNYKYILHINEERLYEKKRGPVKKKKK